MPIDGFDAKILNVLQQDNLRSAAKIGDAVGLSPSAVNRRIATLMQDGVITDSVALVSWKALGFGIRASIVCTLDRDSPDTRRRFITALQKDRFVVRAVPIITGDADFAMTVVARDIDAYDEHVRSYQDSFPSLRSIRSYVLDGELKRGYVIPVELAHPDREPPR